MADEMNLDFDDMDFDGGWGDDEVQEKPGEEIGEEDFLDTMEPSKKSMTIFFLIDTSGSMSGTKMGSWRSFCRSLSASAERRRTSALR